MRTRLWLIGGISLFLANSVYADAYRTLLQRYESQIKQQERRLRGLRKNLVEKETEAKRWQQRAEAAKLQWTRSGAAVERARSMVQENHQRRTRSATRAEAAQWTVMEHMALSQAADAELTHWTLELYKNLVTPRYFADVSPIAGGSGPMIEQLASLAKDSQSRADQAQENEASLRMEELRWRQEELKQTLALDKHRQEQQSVWLRWQEALQRRKSLEEERAQLEQSAQAMRVMLTELRGHRERTLASRSDTPRSSAALRSIRGALPWPASGIVTQNFGKQYSDQLQQLVISNGIKLEAETGKPVRTVQQGKVLFARPFQQYGQLVIIQHPHGLTSVYGGLGQTQVKEGDVLSTLDTVGTVGESRSFYFELRQDEEPINPIVWLAPLRTADVGLSSRRKYQ